VAIFKRKKKTKITKGRKAKDPVKKIAESDEEQPGIFWRQAASVLLILLAILLLFGGFGTGGPLPVGLFDFTRKSIGVLAFAAPILLVLAAITKIRSPKHQLSRQLFWGFVVFMITATGFAHLFVDPDQSLQAVEDGVGGGYIGHLTDSAILSFLSKVTGGIVLFVIALIAMHFIFNIKFNYLFKLLHLSKKSKDETAVEDENPLERGRYAINEGVALQRSKPGVIGEDGTDQVGVLIAARDPQWNYPGIDLLDSTQDSIDPGDIVSQKEIIHHVLGGFEFDVEMKEHFVGPRLTQYTLLPPSDMNINRLPSYENNLAMELAATSVRIQAPIPGKKAVGVEVPNKKPA
jgi:S-DNA-T family DNA segregation ATPase FtsK/SpoIIIE